jgi:glycosyltransferase involved in cell wall biosynthesis
MTLDFTGHDPEEQDVIRIPARLRFRYKQNPVAIPQSMRQWMHNVLDRENPDIVHVHHPLLIGSIAARLAKRRHIPVIFTHHTLYDRYAHYLPLPGIITRPIIRWWVARFCNRVDAVIAPSSFVKHQLLQDKVHAHIAVMPSPIASYFLASEQSKKPEVSKPLQLLTVSRFMPEKNLYTLLDVCRKLPLDQFHLTLIGFGAEYKRLYDYAYHVLGFSKDQIAFVVRPPKHVIAEWYRNADLFLFTSQTETQGLVLAEAMGAGTPVIALQGPGVEDIVVSGYNGFLVDSPDAMIQKIRDYIAHRLCIAELQRGARTTAEYYTPKKQGKHLIALYQEVRKNHAAH